MERLACTEQSPPSSVKHVANQFPQIAPTTTFVRIMTNDAPIPIPSCQSGPGLSCPLEEFAEFVAQRGKIVGDFVTVCGLSSVKNATSLATFFTDPIDVNGSG